MVLLLVEDNALLRQWMRALLKDLADEICERSDGTEALPAYIKHHPDWVLMDVEMKQMDGIQATREIMREFPEARVIIVTNHTDKQTREAAREAGAKGFVSKEHLVELRSMIRRPPTGIDE
jgi:DNA-binding NarL/FixJ family response regulator